MPSAVVRFAAFCRQNQLLTQTSPLIMRNWLAISLVFSTVVASPAQAVNLGCKQLRVVLDKRLNPAVLEQEWGSGNIRSEIPATLQLIDCQGQLLDQIVLAAPLAQLDPAPVQGVSNPTFLVTVDLTAPMGSYSGPLTIPYQVVNDHLIASIAKTADQRLEAIALSLTGKSAWQRVSNDNGDEFFFVSCQPKDQGFVTTYRHYTPSVQAWTLKSRDQQGLWESDGDFPDRKNFP